MSALLAIDTATSATSVALRDRGGLARELRDDPADGERPRHSTHALTLAEELLERAGLGWEAIEMVAVGLGPGTFTGLRVGVATARALGQSLGVPVSGASSSAALALAALAGGCERVLCVLDARRSEAFVAAYRLGEDGMPLELAAPQAVEPSAICSVAKQVDVELGRGSWLAVGDGAVRYAAAVACAEIEVAALNSPLHLVRAAALCELAARSEVPHSLEEVLPLYGRSPDAKPIVDRDRERRARRLTAARRGTGGEVAAR